MILALLIGCGGSGADEDDDDGGLVLGDSGGGAAPSMEQCEAWLAQSQAESTPHSCATDEYRNIVTSMGGAVFPVGDDRYYVAWIPRDWDGETVVYAVHGSTGCAEMLVDLYAATAGVSYAVLSLQFRGEAGSQDYDSEETIYDNLQTMHSEVAASCPVGPASRAYYGYSRGGGRGYGIAALDGEGAQLFDAFVIDSGTNSLGQLAGTDSDALQRSRFWLWCGTLDPDPTDSSRTTCEVMDQDMLPWIEDHSGTVDAFIEEEGACHGMFFGNCDSSCNNCQRRSVGDLGPSLPLLFDYLNGL